MASTLAGYQIAKTNVPVPDPAAPPGLHQNSRGEAGSRGIGLTLQGQLTADLSAASCGA